MLEKRIAEPLDDGIVIGPRLGFHADAGENRNDLFFKEVVEVGAHPRIGHRLAHRHVRRAFFWRQISARKV